MAALPPVLPPPRLLTRRRNFLPTAEEMSRLCTLSDAELRMIVANNGLNVMCRRWIIRFLRSHKPAAEDLWRLVTMQPVLPEVDLTPLDFDSLCCTVLRQGDTSRLNAILFELACMHVPEKAMHLMEVLQRSEIDVANVQVESEGLRILAEEIRESVLGRCSWCRKYCMHILQQFNLVRRNVYTCLSCNNRTVACRNAAFGTCGNLARGHATWDEESCIVCSNEVSDWNAEAKTAKGRCDWCDTDAVHVLEKSGFGVIRVRDIYRCLNCNRRTLPCRKCPSFARGHGSYDDERCSRCVGIPEATMNLPERRCSWCLEMGTHVLQQHNSVTRHVYKCLECHCRTTQCRSCDVGMARSSPGMAPADWRCAMCSEGIPWDTLHYFMLCRSRVEISAQSAVDPPSFARLERVLRLQTEEKRRAFEAGMIRPFMVLVSMSSTERARVASLLDFNLFVHSYRLVGSPGLEDMAELLTADAVDSLAHKEAWHIIGADFSGIQARSNEFYQTFNANWDETLTGVCRTVFNTACRKLELRHKESMRRCLNASDARVQELEAEIMERFGRMNRWVEVAKKLSDGGEAGEGDSKQSSPAREGSSSSRCSEAFREAVWRALTWSAGRGEAPPMPRARRSSLVDDAVGMATGDLSTTSESVDTSGKFTADSLVSQAATVGIQLALVESSQIALSMGFAVAGEVLVATSVVLAVVAGVFLLWDVLHLLFGTSFSRLFPSVLIMTAAGRQLDERIASFGGGRTLAYFVCGDDSCDLPDDSPRRRSSIVSAIGNIFTPSKPARSNSYTSLGSQESVTGSPGSLRTLGDDTPGGISPASPAYVATGASVAVVASGGMASVSAMLVRARSIQDDSAAELSVHAHDADHEAPLSVSPRPSDPEKPLLRRELSIKRRPSLLDSFLQLVNDTPARDDSAEPMSPLRAGSDEFDTIEGVAEDQEDFFVCARDDRSALQFMH